MAGLFISALLGILCDEQPFESQSDTRYRTGSGSVLVSAVGENAKSRRVSNQFNLTKEVGDLDGRVFIGVGTMHCVFSDRRTKIFS